jgi:hypothetical protein
LAIRRAVPHASVAVSGAMKASSSIRALRAAVFAALCVLLAAGGHTLATGAAPPVWVQAAGFVPVFVAGFLLGGRERSLSAIGAGTVTAQGGLHLAFDAVRPHTGSFMQGMHGMSATHGMRMGHAQALTPHATAAHVGAAMVLTWWLRRGEAALWSLLRRAATLVPGLVAWWQVRGGAWTLPVARDAVRQATDGARALRRILLRHAVQRRGPPHAMSYAN